MYQLFDTHWTQAQIANKLTNLLPPNMDRIFKAEFKKKKKL